MWREQDPPQGGRETKRRFCFHREPGTEEPGHSWPGNSCHGNQLFAASTCLSWEPGWSGMTASPLLPPPPPLGPGAHPCGCRSTHPYLPVCVLRQEESVHRLLWAEAEGTAGEATALPTSGVPVSRLLCFPPNESKMSAGILGSIPESPKRNPEISDPELPEWLKC